MNKNTTRPVAKPTKDTKEKDTKKHESDKDAILGSGLARSAADSIRKSKRDREKLLDSL